MLLSIVIPCLNEEGTLPIVIGKSLKTFERLNIEGEVIVSDNGSTDKSVEVAQSCGARVVHCPKKGYGKALIYGMKAAQGKWLIMGDADDSYNFEEIDDFIKYLGEGYDLVMGTRIKGRIEKGAMPFLHRYLGTPVLTRVLNSFFSLNISDCNCGMRGLTKRAFLAMNLLSEGMEFASEMMIKAGLNDLKIKEIPITLYCDKRDRAPHLRTWSDGWRHLRFMMLYAPKHTFMLPGLLFMLIGLLLMVPLAFGPTTLGPITLDYHWSLLGSLFAAIGFQALNIGVFAKIYAYAHGYVPLDEFITKFQRVFKLERGILYGCSLFVVGLMLNSGVLVEWIRSDFGGMHRAGMVALASTCMIFGLQIFFASFFISTMYLHKEEEAPQEASESEAPDGIDLAGAC